MKKASYSDRDTVVSILSDAFKNNKSVKYIAGNDESKRKFLMLYSFEMCMKSGEVYISEEGDACALIQFYDKKKFSWKGIYWDIMLILKCVGLPNVFKVLSREGFIKNHYPQKAFTYLWFIGVKPGKQGRGAGTKALQHILDHSSTINRSVFLETSTERNLPWYKKQGFEMYSTSDRFGFPFYFLKN